MRKRPSFIIGVLAISGIILDQGQVGPWYSSLAKTGADFAARASVVPPDQLKQEALANVLEFARHILWPSKNQFGWLSHTGLLALPAGVSPVRFLGAGLGFRHLSDDFDNLRLVKQSRMASGNPGALGQSLEQLIVVEGGEQRLFHIKELMIKDAELRAQVLEIQKVLHLTHLVLRTGASEITRLLGMEGDLLAELELTVDSDVHGNVSIETVRQRDGRLVFYFNLIDPESLVFMTVVHEVHEAYETIRALRGGMSEFTWNILVQGLGSSTSQGYFHWKAVEAEIRSAFFAAVPNEYRINFAFELFSIGFGLLDLYRAHVARHLADARLLRGTIKDLRRLESITRAPEFNALKMRIWEQWRHRYGRSAPLNPYAVMSEADRERHLIWVRRFISEAPPKSNEAQKRAG
jgi:hypothetical protein